jgi:hypothetical protein
MRMQQYIMTSQPTIIQLAKLLTYSSGMQVTTKRIDASLLCHTRALAQFTKSTAYTVWLCVDTKLSQGVCLIPGMSTQLMVVMQCMVDL